jgi:hypothetical protein
MDVAQPGGHGRTADPCAATTTTGRRRAGDTRPDPGERAARMVVHIEAPSSMKNATGTRDPVMRQTKEGSQWYSGSRTGRNSHARPQSGPRSSTHPDRQACLRLHQDPPPAIQLMGGRGAEGAGQRLQQVPLHGRAALERVEQLRLLEHRIDQPSSPGERLPLRADGHREHLDPLDHRKPHRIPPRSGARSEDLGAHQVGRALVSGLATTARLCPDGTTSITSPPMGMPSAVPTAPGPNVTKATTSSRGGWASAHRDAGHVVDEDAPSSRTMTRRALKGDVREEHHVLVQ